MQVIVSGKGNEITAALQLPKCMDLRGKVVTGMRCLAQWELSAQFVEAESDSV